MGYRAVALSQVDGAGGESIGRSVAEKLGYGYLDEAIVVQVARQQGVDESVVMDSERRRSLVERFLQTAALGSVEGVAFDPSMYTPDESGTFLSLIRDAVRDAATQGNVVLVAHGACYACAGHSEVLRVWLTAPSYTRVSRVASAHGISEKEAAKLLRRSDAGRASYLRRVYDVDQETPTDYDLVVNTEHLGPEDVVTLLVAALGAEPAPRPPAVPAGEADLQ